MVSGWRTGLLASTAAALAACAAPRPAALPSADGSNGVAAGSPFTLAVGARVEVESQDVTIEFQSVESDSRCPRNVTCVWAGDAVAVIEVGSGGKRETVRLHTNLEPKKAVALGAELELVGLSPYPVAPGGITPADYRVQLVARPIQP